LTLAAISNAVMDASAEGRLKGEYWIKNKSWRYKYKDGNPALGEKFFGSSTFLVFLTDGWHLAQFFFHSSWQLALAINLPMPIVSFIIIKTSFSLLFEITYSRIKR
jgi:hypothetical protein